MKIKLHIFVKQIILKYLNCVCCLVAIFDAGYSSRVRSPSYYVMNIKY